MSEIKVKDENGVVNVVNQYCMEASPWPPSRAAGEYKSTTPWWSAYDEIVKIGHKNVLLLIELRPVRSVLGLISYTSSSDEPIMVPCRVVEKRYKLEDNYKIEIECLYPGFEKRDYYKQDFDGSARDGWIRVFKLVEGNS